MTIYVRGIAGIGRHGVEASDPGDDWRTRGACRDADPELFFTNGDGEPSRQQERLAQSVCRRCPVQVECGTWAVESRQQYGVWGAMTEKQLRAAVRQARQKPENRGAKAQPCGTWAAYQRHLRQDEPIDDACRAAQARHREQYAKKQEASR